MPFTEEEIQRKIWVLMRIDPCPYEADEAGFRSIAIRELERDRREEEDIRAVETQYRHYN